MKPSNKGVYRMKTPKQKIESLQQLNWNKVQIAGSLFADALEGDKLEPTQEQLADLIMLTAKLLEFVSEVKEIVHDSDSVSLAS